MSVLAHQDICDCIVGPEECNDISKITAENLLSASEEWDSALAFLEEEYELVRDVFNARTFLVHVINTLLFHVTFIVKSRRIRPHVLK